MKMWDLTERLVAIMTQRGEFNDESAADWVWLERLSMDDLAQEIEDRS